MTPTGGRQGDEPGASEHKLDDVRDALRAGDLKRASRLANRSADRLVVIPKTGGNVIEVDRTNNAWPARSLVSRARLLGLGTFPSSQSRGGCGINKKARSHRSAADGGRSPRKPDRAQPSIKGGRSHTMFTTHSETCLVSDHPVRDFSERDHFLVSRPPLLCKEGNLHA